jgi:3'(2'), 5'-bisphosphate nucleotidase
MDRGLSLSRELDVAVSAALSAGRLALGYHGTGVEVEHKAGDEPVTRADREASELILARLREAFPDDVLISEEAADDPRRLEAGVRVWFVDPIDGTRDFIRGLAGFAVMIGLVVDTRPRRGVVYQPVGDRLFFAAPGVGTRMRSAEGERVLRCSAIDDPAEIRLVASKSHRTPEIDQVKSALGIVDEMNIGSVGLKLGLIALAERDLYVNPSSKSKAWDTCAPEAILAEAGGRITDLYGAPLHYDRVDLWNARGLLATNGAVHDAVLAKLAPLFPAPPNS